MLILTPIYTVISSALHGYGKVKKIYPTIAMCLLCTFTLYVNELSYLSLLGLVIGYLWRIVTRSGDQAHAELVAMDTINYTNISRTDRIRNVWKAHYYNPFGYLLGLLITKYLNYDKIPYKLGDSFSTRFWDTRRYVEIASGLLPQASFVISLLVLTIVIFG